MSELVAVCAHFNPCKYKKRLDNYKVFREGMDKAGVQVITAEAIIGEGESELAQYDDVLRFDVKDVMWYKEQLLEKGIDYVRKNYKYPYIMWVDADTVFTEKNWVNRIVDALQKYKLVQGFNLAFSLHSDGLLKKYCSVDVIRNNLSLGKGAPGGVWAARTDFFDKHSLYKYAIVGGGDAIFCLAMCFKLENNFEKFVNLLEYQNRSINFWSAEFRKHCLVWAINNTMNLKDVGFVKQKAVFLEHGPMKPRWGSSRLEIMQYFDPNTDIRVSKETGFLEWSNKYYERKVYGYFKGRNEDISKECQNIQV